MAKLRASNDKSKNASIRTVSNYVKGERKITFRKKRAFLSGTYLNPRYKCLLSQEQKAFATMFRITF